MKTFTKVRVLSRHQSGGHGSVDHLLGLLRKEEHQGELE